MLKAQTLLRTAWCALGVLLIACGSDNVPAGTGEPDGDTGGSGDGGVELIDTEGSDSDDGVADDTDADDADADADVEGSGDDVVLCTTDEECEGEPCVPLNDDGSIGVCTTYCELGNECPEGFDCVLIRSSGPDGVRVCLPTTFCLDRDDDNYGIGPGCAGPDCDDRDSGVNPGQRNVCDGRDTNCAGSIDVDPQFGTVQGNEVRIGEACETGFDGACSAGRWSCMTGLTVCEQSTSPSEELCNGVDDDCDGLTDEDAEGNPMRRTFYRGPAGTEGVGLCTPGVEECQAAEWVVVTEQILPSLELCDGLDWDCTGAPSDVPTSELQSDLMNCGGCGVMCVGEELCVAGVCGCAGGEALCGETCHDLQTDIAHCGECAAACILPQAVPACTAGVCAVASCLAGWGNCDGDDSNGCETPLGTLTDCGACGATCDTANSSEVCAAGTCLVETCDATFDDCDGFDSNGCETSLRTLASCGACGVACAPANAAGDCSGGTCGIASCNAGWSDCDGNPANGCETPLTTNTNCGACGVTCAPASGRGDCTTGVCTVSSCLSGFDDCDGLAANGCETSLRSLTDCGECSLECSRANGSETCATGSCQTAGCDAGFANCDGVDVNGCETALTTLTNCGACGVRCDRANAAESCETGACEVTTCNAGFANCDADDSNGCETPTTTLANCGTCGTSCSRANASASCSTGTCQLLSCNPGWSDCDGNPANGCETPLNTNANCGACGVACAPTSGAGECSTGVCRVTTCAAGFDDCDDNDANGCETSIRTLNDCGTCGVSCSRPNATATCSGGFCAIASCNPGWANCDGIDSNGCETPTTTLANCGACGAVCELPGASESCATGVCEFVACDAGFDNCDGRTSNGCETALTNLANCGACGSACSRANATATCGSGTCAILSCNPGWSNCDGNDANGCETPITTLTDCGSCGTPCSRANGSASCASGTCTTTGCNAGFSNCDGVDANGCETALTSLTNCGGCGVPCDRPNATESCATGTCETVACNTGSADCDGDRSNGCETPTTTLANCGACGVACARPNAAASCSSGTCELLTCNPGWANCDGNDANGCETPLNTNFNCGACGVACTPSSGVGECSTGVCRVATCAAGFDDCDNNDLNGCETSIRTLNDCGSCGTPCSRANATATCSNGICGISSCNAGWANCDGIDSNGCETPTTTLANCGACGVACSLPGAGETCATGVCEFVGCDPGFENCDGNTANGCETPTTTLANCGACGTTCARNNASATCSSGTCGILSCNAGWSNCDGIDSNGCETSLRTLTDCGECSVECARENAAETCASGTCQTAGCDAGFANCDGVDVNGCETPLNSLASCGACGVACDRANASESCQTGTCQITSCNPGFANCDADSGNGCETPTTTISNCGTCGTACSRDNAAASCASGTCELVSCNAGWANCDGNPANGCETPLTNNFNCGACGVTCTPASGIGVCSTGTCQIATCNAGFSDCDGSVANGCETNIRTLNDCGTCGTSCSRDNATATCGSGVCAILSCNPGWANCDGIDSNGCETPTTSLANCGACGVTCDLAGATESCTTGTCQLVSCNTGFANCDNNAANGCEVSLNTTANCGACGTTCSRDNATATCSSGSCAILTCNPGFANCDGNDANGCETPTTSVANCGACGTTCSRDNATATCSSGTCSTLSCNPGFSNCDGTDSNGCETDIWSTANCGSCGVSCDLLNASESCSTGTCQLVTCNPGFANCDAESSNGCETALNTNNSCGACGVQCARDNATASCSSGSCQLVSCNSGFGNCDGNAANGCETQLNSNNSCGACGTLCSRANATATCSSGSCQILACNPGFANCNGIDSDGCEVNLNTTANCGACGNSCSLSQATAICPSGTCQISTCASGFGNCDGIAANGCETALNTTSNCGACGASCSRAGATATCGTGTCQIASCNPGLANCDGNSANGCEASLSSLNNCGACGASCSRNNATATCATGSCNIASCNSGFANCDGNQTNGCETSLTTNSDCGACGAVCSRANASASCSSGSCELSSCNTGFSTCDGNAGNGCELQHSSNLNACNSNTPDVGDYDGDRSCGFVCGGNTDWNLFATRTGNRSAWFQARAREDSDCSASIEHQIRLSVPAGTDYDLYVYRSCGTLTGSSTLGTGQQDIVTISQGDNFASSDSFDYWVEVRWYSGSSCSTWTLEFYGHDC